MKRFWLILLSLGLVMAFGVSAYAVDVQFSGDYYVGGVYLDKLSLTKDAGSLDQGSTFFYYQRLRARMDFVVSPGLTLVTRITALERVWGGPRSTGTTGPVDSIATWAENQNIAFDWAYVDYHSPIGIFDVGYQPIKETGTVFGNNSVPGGRIKYILPLGAFTLQTDITQIADNSQTAFNTPGYTDADNVQYGLEGKYDWKDNRSSGRVGMKIVYYEYDSHEPAPGNYKSQYFLFDPYLMAKIGPVDIQAEVLYDTGRAYNYNVAQTPAHHDEPMNVLGGFVDATATFGQFYIGGFVAYVAGQDPSNTGSVTGGQYGTISGGYDWNPCLIMFNTYDTYNWIGPINGYNTTNAANAYYANLDGPMINAWFEQIRGGFRPIPALDIMASLSYASADKLPQGYASGSYGEEIDLTGTYKITNNLSYMLGVGYLFTGNYFKGANSVNSVTDDFMVLNKLYLKF